MYEICIQDVDKMSDETYKWDYRIESLCDNAIDEQHELCGYFMYVPPSP